MMWMGGRSLLGYATQGGLKVPGLSGDTWCDGARYGRKEDRYVATGMYVLVLHIN